jgi:hypothetical protein
MSCCSGKTFTISLHSHQFRCHLTYCRNIILYKCPENSATIGNFVREILSWKRVADLQWRAVYIHRLPGKRVCAILAHAVTPHQPSSPASLSL